MLASFSVAYWIFQSVPRNFDLPSALRLLKTSTEHNNVLAFLVTRYEKEIKPDDTVYLCFGGQQNPGLYAIATVLSGPDEFPMEDWQLQYAADGPHPWDETAEKKPLRVRLRIVEHLTGRVAVRDIYMLEEMSATQFVRTHGNGTNFRLTLDQKDAIERLIASTRAVGSTAPVGSRPKN